MAEDLTPRQLAYAGLRECDDGSLGAVFYRLGEGRQVEGQQMLFGASKYSRRMVLGMVYEVLANTECTKLSLRTARCLDQLPGQEQTILTWRAEDEAARETEAGKRLERRFKKDGSDLSAQTLADLRTVYQGLPYSARRALEHLIVDTLRRRER